MRRNAADSGSMDLPAKNKGKAAADNAISQSSLFDLQAITAEHKNAFSKDGRKAVRGGGGRSRVIENTRDQFNRPSPGLVNRLARESKQEQARQAVNRARDFDDESEEAEARRRANMAKKAEKYELMQRGRLEGMSDKELDECMIDFERKWNEKSKPPPRARGRPSGAGVEESDHDSDSSFESGSDSDKDESKTVPRRPGSDDESDRVEYTDDLGRTRMGSRAEAERAAKSGGVYEHRSEILDFAARGQAYAEVQKSAVIVGDQNYFPVYEPSQEELQARYKKTETQTQAAHYDATKEVRTKAAGQYQFSQDEQLRAEQMADLKRRREETEAARKDAGERAGASKVEIAKKRKNEERKALLDAKRAKLLGGQEQVERLREEKRAKEAEKLLAEVEGLVEAQTEGAKEST